MARTNMDGKSHRYVRWSDSVRTVKVCRRRRVDASSWFVPSMYSVLLSNAFMTSHLVASSSPSIFIVCLFRAFPASVRSIVDL